VSAVIENVESHASYLRIAQCDKRFEVLAIIALEMRKWAQKREEQLVERQADVLEGGEEKRVYASGR